MLAFALRMRYMYENYGATEQGYIGVGIDNKHKCINSVYNFTLLFIHFF